MAGSQRQRLRRSRTGGHDGGGPRSLRHEPVGESHGGQAAPLPAQGHQRHLPLHGRRSGPDGHVRSEAQAARRARPADPAAGTAHHRLQHHRQGLRLSLRVQQARRIGPVGQRAVPERGDLRRRPVPRSLDGRGPLRAHRRQLLRSHRLRVPGPSVDGGLGYIRTRQRVRRPAGLRRPRQRPDPPRRDGLFRERIPARLVSGHAVPPRQAPDCRHRSAGR